MRSLFRLDLDFDRNIVILTALSTLLIIVDRYHKLTAYKFLDRLLLYLMVPMIVIWLVERRSPREYGFGVGDWKAGLAIVGLAVVVMTPVIWLVARFDPAMQGYYDHQFSPFAPVRIFLDLFGWEFFFRGWLLFGYARKFGSHALWLQAVPFALAHLGKPEIETLSTIFGGFVFGLIAWRTRSFLYPFLIHWFIYTLVVFITGGYFG